MLRQLLAVVLLAVQVWTTTNALGTNYEHDGETTYCWHIPQPPKNTKLNETDRVEGFLKQDCPMVMTVVLSKYTVAPFEVVNVTWTVTADFSRRNSVNMTKVVYGPDSAGNPAQIVHSNVHSCVFGTGCDPFNDGEQLVDKTTNRIANFSDNHVTFTDMIKFPKTGDYSILAHIIMPETNASKRFDYAVYAELVVQDGTPEPAAVAPVVETPAPTTIAAESSSGGLSSAATIGIIVGGIVVVVALIVVAVIFRRRKHDVLSPSQGYMAPPAYDASVQLLTDDKKSDVGGGRGVSDCVTDTSTTAGFQSAWSGPNVNGTGNSGSTAAGRPSQNLDGTGASNVSGSSYASSSYMIERESQMLNQSRGGTVPNNAAAMYRDSSITSKAPSNATSAAAPPQRSRRVDSDVEL